MLACRKRPNPEGCVDGVNALAYLQGLEVCNGLQSEFDCPRKNAKPSERYAEQADHAESLVPRFMPTPTPCSLQPWPYGAVCAVLPTAAAIFSHACISPPGLMLQLVCGGWCWVFHLKHRRSYSRLEKKKRVKKPQRDMWTTCGPLAKCSCKDSLWTFTATTRARAQLTRV